MSIIDLRDGASHADIPRPPLDLYDELRRAAALVIHAVALGCVALVGGIVARLVAILA